MLEILQRLLMSIAILLRVQSLVLNVKITVRDQNKQLHLKHDMVKLLGTNNSLRFKTRRQLL